MHVATRIATSLVFIFGALPVSALPLQSKKMHTHTRSVTVTAQEILPLQSFRSILETTITQAPQRWSQLAWVGNRQPTLQELPQCCLVQKLLVDAESKLIVIGDLHGEPQTLFLLVRKLVQEGILDDQWHVVAPKTYIIGLGDYVDRGPDSVTVLSTLLRLAQINPTTVILLRGNHEDVAINNCFGFRPELFQKYGQDAEDIFPLLERVYATLPVALYVGIPGEQQRYRYLQFCHAGIEVGYTPQALFAYPAASVGEVVTQLLRQERFVQLGITNGLPWCEKTRDVTSNLTAYDNGFLWNDFSSAANGCLYQCGRGLMCSKRFTELVCRSQQSPFATITGIVRGHQHGNALALGATFGTCVLPWSYPVITTVSFPLNSAYMASFLQLTPTATSFGWMVHQLVYQRGKWNSTALQW